MSFENERDEQNFSSQESANWEDVLSDENDITLDLDDQNSVDVEGIQQDYGNNPVEQTQSVASASGIQADIIMDDDDEFVSSSTNSVQSAQDLDDSYDVLAQSGLEQATEIPINSPQQSNDYSQEFAYESDDEELARILSDDAPSRQNAFNAFGSGSDNQQATPSEQAPQQNEPETFDIDAQLAEILSDGDIGPDTTAEFKHKKAAPIGQVAVQNKSSASPVVVVGLLVLLVFALYTGFKYVKSSISTLTKDTASQVQVGIEEAMQENETQEQGIPIIREDEINDELSALIGDEKKETVDIDSAGRSNPFMPSDKYKVVPPVVSTKAKDTNVFDLTGIPMPPSKYGELDETVDAMSSVAVSGILYDATSPSAILTFENNDYFVQKGDKLGDYKVIDISKDQVAISYGKNIYKARVGEDFKIFNKFYGAAQFLPKKSGGGRQYELVDESRMEDDGDSSDSSYSPSSSNYVSSRDVEVKAKRTNTKEKIKKY